MSFQRAVLIFMAIFQTNFQHSEAAKILMIPLNGYSHRLFFARLGEELGLLGHKVELLYPSSMDNIKLSKPKTNENFTATSYQVDSLVPFPHADETSSGLLEVALSKSILTKIKIFNTMINVAFREGESDCFSLMDNTNLIQRLKKTEFDLVILDPASTPECFQLIPRELNVRYAYFSVSWLPTVYRVPRFSSFSPIMTSGLTDKMAFFERLLNLGLEFLFNFQYWVSDSSAKFAMKYNHDPSITFHSMLQNASLWFYLEDITISHARPSMPNTVSIGDIMAGQPLGTIPKTFENFLQRSPDGAILVSFGSYFDSVPAHLANMFCEAFRQLRYQVIWKLKNETHCSDVKNVHVVKWIPQNDLLAHEKVRLFITHGGFSSLMESVYHAKPLIVFPLFSDQLDNAAAVLSKGYGITMNIAEFTVEDLITNVEKIFQNQAFTEKIKSASAILRDQPNSPGERASYLINHMIKHGDQHLRTGAYQLSIFEYFMLDLFIFIFIFLISICLFLFCVCRYMVRFALKSRPSDLKAKMKSN